MADLTCEQWLHAFLLAPERFFSLSLAESWQGGRSLRSDLTLPRVPSRRETLTCGVNKPSRRLSLPALRQVLHYAVRIKLVDENVAAAVPNPEPKRAEVQVFTPGEVEAIAEELGSPIPVFAAWTGLRPEEWLALERGDLEKARGLVRGRRVLRTGT